MGRSTSAVAAFAYQVGEPWEHTGPDRLLCLPFFFFLRKNKEKGIEYALVGRDVTSRQVKQQPGNLTEEKPLATNKETTAARERNSQN